MKSQPVELNLTALNGKLYGTTVNGTLFSITAAGTEKTLLLTPADRYSLR